jgi:hypothetical protein
MASHGEPQYMLSLATWRIRATSIGTGSLAPSLHRTARAERICGEAHRRPEFHHGLIPVAGALRTEKHLCSAPRLGIGSKQALKDTLDVSIDYRGGQSESDAADRRAGVAADARQCEEPIESGWHATRVRVDYHAGGGMHRAGPPVVSQSAPDREYLRKFCRGEGPNRGKSFHETTVVVENSRDPRLLQHDLGNPDEIGIRGPAPRQIATLSVIPAKKRCT